MRSLRLISLCTLLLFSQWATAAISISDPIGDHTGTVDVTGLVFDFDTTGLYTITVTADVANPFIDAFRININLFNVTQDEFFQDAFNDFDLATPTTLVVLDGVNPLIADWNDTDTVAASTLEGLGNPSGSTFFRTSVADLPFSAPCVAEDIIGVDGCRLDVPTASTLALIIGGLGVLPLMLGIRRRNRR